MPTITHALVTGAIALIFYFQTLNISRLIQLSSLDSNKTNNSGSQSGQQEDKAIIYSQYLRRARLKTFNTEHVIVFSLNGFLGPDISKLLSPFYGSEYWNSYAFKMLNGFIHTIVGWIITSFILGILYYYLFKLKKENKTGEGGYKSFRQPISYISIVLLIIGGGLVHFGLDLLDSGIRLFPVQFQFNYVINFDLFRTGSYLSIGPLYEFFPWFDDKYLLLIGIGFLILLVWELNHLDIGMDKKADVYNREKNKTISVKVLILTALLFVVLILGAILGLGSIIVSNENDVGYFIYSVVFWILPVFFCYISESELVFIRGKLPKNQSS